MLFNAIKNNDYNRVVDLIRHYNIDVNKIEDNEYISPLHYAVECGNKDIVISILEHGADVNLHTGDIQTPIHTAVNAGNLEMVKLLVENGADVDTCNNCEYHATPLQNSVNNNSYDITEFLLQSGADTHETCTILYPVMSAIKSENIEMLKLLLKYNASIDKMEHGDGYPINLAVRYGNFEIVHELLKHGADPNSSYRYASCLRIPLHQAIYYHNTDIVKLLIMYGADVNSIDDNGNTPMHLAVNEKQVDIVKILLDARADITIINGSLTTSLIGCYSSSQFPREITEMLISRTVLYKYTNANIIIDGLLLNWLVIESDEASNHYKIECEKEIINLVGIKIGNSCLFDACLGKVNYKCLLRYLINNKSYVNKCKIYREMLEKNILAANERDVLIKESLKSLESMIDNKVLSCDNRWNVLPIELKHMILCYLNNDELRIIVNNK
ncbi:ankyrin repeat protein [Cheloniid poxvirus 1]|nr:ankyrin repeat protein [Cheloniid poxvirus 1]